MQSLFLDNKFLKRQYLESSEVKSSGVESSQVHTHFPFVTHFAFLGLFDLLKWNIKSKRKSNSKWR